MEEPFIGGTWDPVTAPGGSSTAPPAVTLPAPLEASGVSPVVPPEDRQPRESNRVESPGTTGDATPATADSNRVSHDISDTPTASPEDPPAATETETTR